MKKVNRIEVTTGYSQDSLYDFSLLFKERMKNIVFMCCQVATAVIVPQNLAQHLKQQWDIQEEQMLSPLLSLWPDHHKTHFCLTCFDCWVVCTQRGSWTIPLSHSNLLTFAKSLLLAWFLFQWALWMWDVLTCQLCSLYVWKRYYRAAQDETSPLFHSSRGCGDAAA